MNSLNLRLKPIATMKRKRTIKKPVAPPPSTTPPPTQTKTLRKTHNSTPKPPSTVTKSLKFPEPSSDYVWVPLNLIREELSLPLTFPTGQTFRWKNTAPSQYTGVVGSHIISLTHLQNGDVSYFLHRTHDAVSARTALLDFLNAGVSLAGIWKVFSDSDERFAELAKYFGGARVLRQEPFECLIQFLCSSNNNIGRITKMVDHVSSMGNYLGSVEGFTFHAFPTLEQLSLVSEEDLRKAGFGYRAKYIIGTVNALQSKTGGGEEWLRSLRKLDLEDVISALSTLPGVGPKVAACIALFSLDQHHAIPVDTHVWQIATKYLLPELAGSRLTPKLCNRVAEAFVTKYGKYAGWAQTLLFIAELPSQKVLLPSHLWTTDQHNHTKKQNSELLVNSKDGVALRI
ncbi:putative DNA-(apurinic or apyrimidinic site) lyase [Lupinus albus]|uniref:DNA-(apurinic or apyrimidinic site) lyase n=1 Tax=Lupinus albus TaxID=3870 RepID=A0A6A4NKX1_LUPAL|nr:putative DNA-(apurinic or apyrimidinic site) lyase [Lupinus albus]